MTRLALPGLAIFLLLILAVEWVIPGPSQPSGLSIPSLSPSAPDSSTDHEIAGWSSAILARPLLSPTRRPAPPAVTNTPMVLPRLSAIIVTHGARRAIFAATGQKPQAIAQGGQIGGYMLETVAPDNVVMVGPTGRVTLKPQFATPAAGQ